MPLYEITTTHLTALDQTSFDAVGLKERADLQRLLREQIAVIAPSTLVICEEFCDWEDSRRRIDLLGIDTQARIVVIELKRSDDGSHMELQAVRYAAMVSALTFDRAVDVYRGYLQRNGSNEDPRTKLLEFLDWTSPEEEEFGQSIRIVLAAADFSKELTSSVMWLNDQGLDITCVRLKPYRYNSTTILDVQQVIPLPEAADYQIQLRQKEQQAKQHRAERHDIRDRFLTELLARARLRTPLHANVSASGGANWVSAGRGIASGISYVYVIHQEKVRAEMYIDRGDEQLNKRCFDQLFAQKPAIETDFGGPLHWERLDNKRACRISHTMAQGGYKSAEDEWHAIQDEMIDSMIRLDRALTERMRKVVAAT
jgi:hypothetical protein